MALHGSLKTMNVADVLQFLAVGQKTGLLKFSRGRVLKGIYVEKGIIVGSNTNDPQEYLGQVLLHYGKIDESQLQAAMEAQRAGIRGSDTTRKEGDKPAKKSQQRLGQVLVSQGVLTEDEVRAVLEIRTLEIIYDLFVWKDGQFEFVAEDPLPEDFTRVNVEVTRVIMEGIYRADEISRYKTLIPSDRAILELGSGWTSSLSVGKETRQLLYYVEKHMSVAEISYNMHASSFEVYAQLYALVKDGLAKVVGELPETPDLITSLPYLPDESEDLLQLARRELNNDSAEQSLSLIHTLLRREPKNASAQSLLLEAEKRFIEQVYAQIPAGGVPKVLIQPNEIAQKEMGPQEGFMLSRINGEWDIQSILSICPFREADSLLMIKKLWDNGVIGF